MLKFFGVLSLALYCSAVATNEEAWADNAVFLQVSDVDVASGTSMATLKKLHAFFHQAQLAAQKDDNIASTIIKSEQEISSIQPQLENMTNFVVNKFISSKKFTENERSKAQGIAIAASVLDGVNILYDMLPVSTKCTTVVVIVWLLFGGLALGFGQGLGFEATVDQLVQMYTSVGYGTSSQESNVEKIFHGFHGVVSQLAVTGALTEFTDILLARVENWVSQGFPNRYTAALNLVLVVTTTMLVFALDLGGNLNGTSVLDGFYQSLITMTTIGYGDKSPSTWGGKFFTPLTVGLLVSAFNRWKCSVGLCDDPESKPPIDFDKEFSQKRFSGDLAFCKCAGYNVCEGIAGTIAYKRFRAGVNEFQATFWRGLGFTDFADKIEAPPDKEKNQTEIDEDKKALDEAWEEERVKRIDRDCVIFKCSGNNPITTSYNDCMAAKRVLCKGTAV